MRILSKIFFNDQKYCDFVHKLNQVIDELKNCATSLNELAQVVQTIANITKQHSAQLLELSFQQKYINEVLEQMNSQKTSMVSNKQVN